MYLFEKFEHTAASQPNKPAFIYYSPRTKNWDVFTYQQFADSTNRFILGLQACSLTPNMTAAVMTPPSIEFFPFACALLKFGIIPIILDPAVGLKKVGEILKESQPVIFIGNTLMHTLRKIFGWGRGTIKHNLTINSVKGRKSKVNNPITNYQLPISNLQSPSTVHRPLSTVSAIIYTSGSTGLPKGAIYTQANLAAQLTMLQQTFHITPDEIDLPAFPLYALIDVLLGVTSVIPDVTFPIPAKTDPEKVIRAIQRFGVTNMFASPVVLDILANWWLSSSERQRGTYRNHPLPSLKRIITAGAPATIPLQQKFRNLLDDKTDLFGIYGATETLPIAKIESREIFSLKEKTEHGAGICLGKPIDGVTVRIIEISETAISEWQDDLEVKKNVIGEITVQSAATTRGYLNRPESNRLSKISRHTCTGVRRKCCEEGALPDEAISLSGLEIAHLHCNTPAQAGGARERSAAQVSGYHPRNDEMDVIHRMGDVGYFDEEGRLWYCGRKSHRVITKDEVLFTEQIENIFNAHPQVNRTALVGIISGPVLWVELEKNAKENKDKIRQELVEMAKPHPQASKIKVFLFMKKFPTDARHNSKIIREELTVMAKNLQLPITNYQ